jgi:hypothetical protein
VTILVGTTREVDRPHIRRQSVATTLLFPAPTLYAHVYEPEEMVDLRERRSDMAQVTENLGTASLVCRVWSRATSTTQYVVFNAAAWLAGTMCEVDNVVLISGTYWVCTTAGRSSSFGSGPVLPSPAVDGTVVWTAVTPTDVFADVEIARVKVWDIDAGGLVDDRYPEYALLPATSYRDWSETGEPLDPTAVLPDVTVRVVDADALARRRRGGRSVGETRGVEACRATVAGAWTSIRSSSTTAASSPSRISRTGGRPRASPATRFARSSRRSPSKLAIASDTWCPPSTVRSSFRTARAAR